MPTYSEGILDKSSAMRSCVDEFETVRSDKNMNDEQLIRLANILQRHIVYSNIIWKGNHRKKENALLDSVDIIIGVGKLDGRPSTLVIEEKEIRR